VIVLALSRLVHTLRAKRYTIVIVEQNFKFALPLADRFYLMEHGEIVEEFAAADLGSKMPMLDARLGV
jgi:branched-chain amino acid transport system ATP-binding protein